MLTSSLEFLTYMVNSLMKKFLPGVVVIVVVVVFVAVVVVLTSELLNYRLFIYIEASNIIKSKN